MRGSKKTKKELIEELKMLKNSGEIYRAFVENIRLGITLIDTNYRIIMTNDAGGYIFSKPHSEFVGKYCFREFEKRDAVCSHCPGTRAMATGRPAEVESEAVRDDGSRVPVRIHAFPVYETDGVVKGFIEVVEDITERRRAEQALKESQETYKTLLENIPQKIFLKDTNSVYISCNDGYAADLKIAPEKIKGKTDYDFYPKQLAEKYRADDREVINSGETKEIEERYLQGGQERIVHTTKTPVRDARGHVTGVLGIFWDITERKRAEQELKEAHDELETRVRQRTADLEKAVEKLQNEVSERKKAEQKLRSLASELSLAEERLRRKIATEVHDHLGQNLAISKMKIESLAQSAASSELARALEEIRDLIAQTVESTRSLTFELSPPVLYELGFGSAVQWLLRQVRQQHGLSTEFTDDERPKPLGDDIRVLLFQAVRELLVNVVKHAKANSVKISMQKVGGQIQVSVEDDGVGFDVARVHSQDRMTGGFGLFNIRERLDHIGGHLDIASRIGRGTRIILTAPITHKKEKNERKQK